MTDKRGQPLALGDEVHVVSSDPSIGDRYGFVLNLKKDPDEVLVADDANGVKAWAVWVKPSYVEVQRVLDW